LFNDRDMRPLTLLVCTTAIAISLASTSGARAVPFKEGGTFRIGIPDNAPFDSIDPVLAGFPAPYLFLDATCASLLGYADARFPQGLHLVPEIATAFPTITDGGRTYGFTIRKGLRFSSGAPITARSFAYTIDRLLNPVMHSGLATDFRGIVGAQAVIEGRATAASGVIARRGSLTIKLTKPDGAFPSRVAELCVVPETTPIDSEGAKPPVAAAGPYYISQYSPNERLVLERNPFYRGERPHHVARFVAEFGGDGPSTLERVDRGDLDYAFLQPADLSPRVDEFRRKYGLDKSRFFGSPAMNLRVFVLNTSRPLFKNNVKLRQAVNFAVDRKAILRERGPLSGYLTDQYLPPFAPGFTNERIYPLKGPDIRRAKGLARGHRRGGKVVIYVSNSAPESLPQGQVLAANLKRIGLHADVQAFPSPVLFSKLRTPGEPFDIGWIGWINIAPPGDTILNWMFDGRTIVNAPDFGNFSYFDSPKYNRLLERASRMPYGTVRSRTYADLDIDLARNAAPAIALAYDRILTLVSSRTGCVVVNPFLDLAAVCLK
jgi:peptide/nickel transport system substrate-binding protein